MYRGVWNGYVWGGWGVGRVCVWVYVWVFFFIFDTKFCGACYADKMNIILKGPAFALLVIYVIVPSSFLLITSDIYSKLQTCREK